MHLAVTSALWTLTVSPSFSGSTALRPTSRQAILAPGATAAVREIGRSSQGRSLRRPPTCGRPTASRSGRSPLLHRPCRGRSAESRARFCGHPGLRVASGSVLLLREPCGAAHRLDLEVPRRCPRPWVSAPLCASRPRPVLGARARRARRKAPAPPFQAVGGAAPAMCRWATRLPSRPAPPPSPRRRRWRRWALGPRLGVSRAARARRLLLRASRRTLTKRFAPTWRMATISPTLSCRPAGGAVKSLGATSPCTTGTAEDRPWTTASRSCTTWS
mmetsp:Transcript_108013/g.344865  ORF Transcript_108013/g.344865 Transcript_108013/m.344865 type:complete len:274 (-) Transcript_108013:815-1636(-)